MFGFEQLTYKSSIEAQLNASNQQSYKLTEFFSDIRSDSRRYLVNTHFCYNKFRLNYLLLFLNNPGLLAVLIYRFGHYVHCKVHAKLGLFSRIFLGFYYHTARYLSVILIKVDVTPGSIIHPGLFLSNHGHIIIGVREIGRNCTIGENVTIGVGRKGESPRIGENVRIGRNSVVYGRIEIGDDVRIDPFSVVGRNIPSHRFVCGNPCKITQLPGVYR